MQEIKKRRIVLASVLKPVDDTRMYEKMGQSLAKKYEVHIIGYPVIHKNTKPGIVFHAHGSFGRLSFKRLIIPWIIFIKILKLEPKHVIITTHELLLQGLLLKILIKTNVYYDIQENYYLNIIHTNAFPGVLRPIIARYVRIKEQITSRWIDWFILAERTYLKELSFTRGKATVVENKFAYDESITATKVRDKSRKGKRFLFSGTLSKTTGVFEAVELVSLLHQQNENVSLTIAGYSAQKQELLELQNLISGKHYISLLGGDTLVPHTQIVSLICESDMGIISYLPNPATQDRIPTKLYEYMACRLPILATNAFDWANMVDRLEVGIVYNPDQIDAEAIIKSISENDFYPAPIFDILWETEEQTLFSVFDQANRK
jgi:glycosyltransferase involved in cell wall biosynthesis